ncbi:hypothetical protein [Nonomuraea fuscirosea]|uniref:hypothetical protein n=1 Tax=Nonomuraea fuscirosea TaxID=1291556 RepID=UPI00343EF049
MVGNEFQAAELRFPHHIRTNSAHGSVTMLIMCERVVLVNGLPGSGRSTPARALGRGLGWPVLSEDALKEILADALDRPDGVGETEWSVSLGRAAASRAPDPFVGDERWREWTAGARPPALGPVYWLDIAKEVEISGLAELCGAPQ